MKPAKRPIELSFRLALYLLKNRLAGRKRFPLVTMLEPLEMCNLACAGCGRIREYQPVIDKMMPVDVALDAVKESGAPIVSIAGGEPTIHPKIDEIINRLIEQKYFVYCCTNGLLLDRMLPKIPPSKYFCWVIHMDGMEEKHDESVARKGVFKKAVQGMELALSQGYRVCTNTTIFKNSDVEDLWEMFRLVNEIGVEGSMISPGYDFEDAPDRDLFLTRQESRNIFKKLLDPTRTGGMKFYNNPLYLNFLQGDREYQCTAWSNPTYTVLGWRKPCYPLADEHVQDVNELYEAGLWQKYGVGNDPRCANCMMHCGFESATIFQAISTPKDWATLIKSGAAHKGGITAA
ncbi:MAG: hopanoid biosynthesis associated radical SAM protein HpnH [SAR202 cluster bacterium MP-SAtl-SRR3965592-G2]|jgi:hopanoid biosynthesis associated radical SAM protein HpnH|nr:MAG: hopanoid biosynthesis associated radical SAM protein HpnH [SAR202 cluster bacterium MP-SAtl-SRR3965592-G2]PKB77361.1 MAG: hopanoid biosynthesis associated radical SAM protein HpnH [SAR202 cluster bacterium MP-SInd-SRR3963457-G2]HIM80233.1 adenosyl-hopene transferase HpnH [Dehalococcoidia bacterium]|tara:strand:+ start:1092 stop:2132 length:1041 start_codon:yes stop_codon:yes gene_type:complete